MSDEPGNLELEMRIELSKKYFEVMQTNSTAPLILATRLLGTDRIFNREEVGAAPGNLPNDVRRMTGSQVALGV